MSMSSTNHEMKQKLTDYMNTVFADAPNTPENRDLKEELTRNLLDRYDDLIAAGRTPSAAYSTAISGVGDIGELIGSAPASATRVTSPARPAATAPQATPRPQPRELTPEEQEAARRYRTRSAVMTSVAIALFILSCVPCIFLDETNVPEAVGVGLMFAMIATGVVLLIINSMTKPTVPASPAEVNPGNTEKAVDFDGEREHPRTTAGKVYKALSAALWLMTVLVYLTISLRTGMWGITWMMFLISAAVDNIMKAIFELAQNREE